MTLTFTTGDSKPESYTLNQIYATICNVSEALKSTQSQKYTLIRYITYKHTPALQQTCEMITAMRAQK